MLSRIAYISKLYNSCSSASCSKFNSLHFGHRCQHVAPGNAHTVETASAVDARTYTTFLNIAHRATHVLFSPSPPFTPGDAAPRCRSLSKSSNARTISRKCRACIKRVRSRPDYAASTIRRCCCRWCRHVISYLRLLPITEVTANKCTYSGCDITTHTTAGNCPRVVVSKGVQSRYTRRSNESAPPRAR